MHTIMKPETQPLDFFVVGQPQGVADVMAHALAEIVLKDGEKPAQNPDQQNGPRRDPQGRRCRFGGGRLRHQRLGLINGASQQGSGPSIASAVAMTVETSAIATIQGDLSASNVTRLIVLNPLFHPTVSVGRMISVGVPMDVFPKPK